MAPSSAGSAPPEAAGAAKGLVAAAVVEAGFWSFLFHADVKYCTAIIDRPNMMINVSARRMSMKPR